MLALVTTQNRSTTQSVGLEMYSANATLITIPRNIGTTDVSTDITLIPPVSRYTRGASWSSLAFKINGLVSGGVINPGYQGNVKIGLINNSNTPFIINIKDHLARIILERIHIPTILVANSIHSLIDRNAQGFGRTEQRARNDNDFQFKTIH